ncbi:hypothetical protein, partial [Nostoc linckia]
MSIPSTPSTAVLKDNLTHAGKYVRTFSTSIKGNWNIPNATKGLTQFSSKDFRNLSKLTNALN